MKTNLLLLDTRRNRGSYPDIVNKVSCPVMVIPDNFPFISFNQIMYATAFSSEDRTALKQLSGLFAVEGGRNLIIFHNNESDDHELKLEWDNFQSLAKEIVKGFSLRFVLSHEKDFRHAIESFINEEDIDLIVILKEKKGFFRELLSGSDTKYVIRHFNKPILVFKEENLEIQDRKID